MISEDVSNARFPKALTAKVVPAYSETIGKGLLAGGNRNFKQLA
jgi:hypothetical protein